MDKAISLKDVWVKYRIDFKEDGKVVHEDFWALQGVNLEINKGDVIAIIGENGAGKTTILKLIAGMLKPDRGIVEVNGRVSALMEIGAGFQRELTGKENIYLIASIHGLRREQIDQRCADVIKFADIGRFINAPVKSYSQGMYMRLAFAIAIYMDSEILMVDDMFVVGDASAQRKCIDKMLSLKEEGRTIAFVSHDTEMIKRFCSRGILLKDGRIIKDGMLKEIVSYYLMMLGDRKGVGILQGEHLGVIFNNGRLILNWDNNSFTKEMGGYINIINDGNSFLSMNSDWEVEESFSHRLVVRGKLWDLPVWQLWEINLDDTGSAVDLKIKLDKQGECKLQEVSARFMFSDNYKYWINPIRSGSFGKDDFLEKFSWQNVNCENPPVSFIGLNAHSEHEESLPLVTLEDNVYIPGKLLEIKNTNHKYNARVLQTKVSFGNYGGHDIAVIGKCPIFHIRIKSASGLHRENNLCGNTEKMLMPKKISDGSNLSLNCDYNNTICIYWKGKRVTSAKGFKTELYSAGNIHHSSDTDYIVHKVSGSRIDMVVGFPGIPVVQIWNIEFLSEGLLSWRVNMDISENIIIRNNKISVMFLPNYIRWVNTLKCGEITEETNAIYQNTIMRNDPCGVIGLDGCLLNDQELPYVLIQDISGCPKFISIEKKTDRHLDAVNISDGVEMIARASFLSLDSRESLVFNKGLYRICDMQMFIGDEKLRNRQLLNIKSGGQLNRKEETTNKFNFLAGFHGFKRLIKGASSERGRIFTEETASRSVRLREKESCPEDFEPQCPIDSGEWLINNGNYRFIFREGRGRIYFRDKEITSGFGVYTSVYSRDIDNIGAWYASLDAIWELVSAKKDKLILKGRWPYIPMQQVWEIKAGLDCFFWNVDMDLFANISIERQQASVMLSGDYVTWFAGEQTGLFSQDFTSISWNCFLRESGVDKVGVESNTPVGVLGPPRLSLSCLCKDKVFEARIENPNAVLSSRSIGFDMILNPDEINMTAGIRKYFQGVINLG